MTRRRASVIAVVGIVIGALGVAAIGVAGWRPAAHAASADGQAPQTATVIRTTLVETVDAPGKIAYGREQAVVSRLTGTVTGLPSIGATIKRGKVLFSVNDQPVILMYGPLPTYRDLTAGAPPTPAPNASGTPGIPSTPPTPAVPASTGMDVRQFEENLKALGYAGFTVDDRYTAETAAAVRKWQRDIGLPESGVVDLGRIYYASGPIRIASHKIDLGAVAAGPVLTFSGTTRLVTATLPQRDQAVAAVGTKVTIVLSSGVKAAGTVASVDTTDQEANPGDEPTLDVVVTPDDPSALGGVDDAATVRFVVQERKGVLAVPVGALLALSGGGYGLQIIADGKSHVVVVTAGLFANGNVEVTGPALTEELTVGMAR